MADYDQGVAFVVEGDTELVFYQEYLQYLVSSSGNGCEMFSNEELGEISYTFSSPKCSSLIRMQSMDTITQIPNSAAWVQRSCLEMMSGVPWHVVLAYDNDTDGYKNPITKFYEGDWLLLRDQFQSFGCAVLDLAACADIEDVMLEDYQGVLTYLRLPANMPMPNGRKGKAKMKKLFHMVAPNNAYREGQRARRLIRSLDMDLIERRTQVPLTELRSLLI